MIGIKCSPNQHDVEERVNVEEEDGSGDGECVVDARRPEEVGPLRAFSHQLVLRQVLAAETECHVRQERLENW